jgi:glycerophosphoryl diester phosphodiesterase
VVTADDQIVVSHDPWLSARRWVDAVGNLLRNATPIRNLTLTQLREFRPRGEVAARDPAGMPPDAIPTLADVFAMLQSLPAHHAREIGLDIELKCHPKHPAWTPRQEEFAALVLANIDRHFDRERIILRSFDPGILRAVRRLDHTIPLTLSVRTISHVDFAELAGLSIGTIAPYALLLTAGDVQALHRLALGVLPWSPNTPSEWRRLIALGVDGITTDDPRGLLEFLSREAAAGQESRDSRADLMRGLIKQWVPPYL